MSLAVGEAHGNDAPGTFSTPQGLNLVCCRDKRFDPSRDGNPRGWHPHPWVSPAANDSVPLRGTRSRPKAAAPMPDGV